MATRTPHTGAALEVFTAANLAKYPKGWMGYVSVTSDTTGVTGTETALTGYTLSITVGSSRLLRIIGIVPRIGSSVASDIAILRLKQDSTALTESWVDVGATTLSGGGGTNGQVVAVVAPAAGTYTFTLRGARQTGTGTLEYRADSAKAGLLVVEDIGPSS